MNYANQVPEIFTEQDRQEVIAKQILTQELLKAGVPPWVLKLDYHVISAILRIISNLDLEWSDISEGYEFVVSILPEQEYLLKTNYFFLSPENNLYLDNDSQVPFKVIWKS